MSLINQMLHDLEQRRTAGVGSSPLSGLSASGFVTQPVGFSVNYMAVAIGITVIFVSGVMVAYFLGSQQQTGIAENTIALEKKISVFVTDTVTVPKITTLPTMVKLDYPVENTVKTNKNIVKKTIIKKPIAKKMTPKIVKSDVENTIEATPVSTEKNIDKTIHPFTDEQQSQLAFQRAIHMLSRNNQQGAQQALEEALSFSSAHLRARETLAAILLNTGRMSEAASRLNEGLHLMPNASPLAKLYARILMDQGDTATAVTVLERARPAVTVDPEYHALLATLYQQVEKHVQAAHAYQQILLQRPGVAQWWMGLALAQDALGKTDLALDAFQRARRIGGLGDEVLHYVQTRIVVLTPVATLSVDSHHDLDEFVE